MTDKEIITDKEKARQLSQYPSGDIDILRYDVAMDMAEWKDEQFVKEKQHIIDTVCNCIKDVEWGDECAYIWYSKEEFIDKIKKALEEKL